MPVEVSVKTVDPTPTAVVAAATTWAEFAQTWGPMLNEVWSFLRGGAPPGLYTHGHNVMLYKDDVPNVEVGVQVTGSFPPAGQVVASELPGGLAATLELASVPDSPGRFAAAWTAPQPGVYVVDLSASRGAEEIGSDAVTFQRLDGVAESFHTEQNRPLLERLAASTGGRYLRASELSSLLAEIPYSQAGISVQQVKELWNMPVAFLGLLVLRAAEWLLRRRWGIV